VKFLNASTSQIDKLVDTQTSRWAISNVFFDAERGHMVATNGHALAVVHVVPEEGDTTGWITCEALQVWRKVMAKAPSYTAQRVKLECRPEVLVVTAADGNQQIFRRPEYRKGSFPDYDLVFPKGVSEKPAFLLDINLLKKLVDALGTVDTLNGKSSPMVAVFPSADNSTAHLVKTSQSGPIGIIMPMRAPDEKAGWLTTLEAVDAHFILERNAANCKAKAVAAAAEEEEEPEQEPEDCAICDNTGLDAQGNLCECGRGVRPDGTIEDDEPTDADEGEEAEPIAAEEPEPVAEPEPEPEPVAVGVAEVTAPKKRGRKKGPQSVAA